MDNFKAYSILLFLFSLLFIWCNGKNIPTAKKIIKVNDTNVTTVVIPSTIKNIEKLPIKKSINPHLKNKTQMTPKAIKIQSKTPKKIVQNTQLSVKKSCELGVKNIDDFKFDIIKRGVLDNNTLLIAGGIQGDEPGGFMSAALLSTHYKILKGSVWIMPNLNFYSIITRERGSFGDMNRKFGYLPKNDPDYKTIQRIKKYILDPHVKLILHLHDGSGFYRPTYIDSMHQPLRWGQASVIDQKILNNVSQYNDSYNISEEIVAHINKHLLKKKDKFRTKNTHTRFRKTYEETEMAKSLTYYAVTHGKASFGNESSKTLTIAQRVYYKILAIEKYMDIMGIQYVREFPLTLLGVKHALDDDNSITFTDTNITIPLKNLRNIQTYFPVNKNGVIKYLPSNPLIKIIKHHDIYTIYYGNRRVTRLKADYMEHSNSHAKITFQIDGKKQKVNLGDTIKVNKNFLVIDEKKFRVNVIGYTNRSGIETNKKISKDKFMRRYSIDTKGKIYRVEFYKKKKFAGMILVEFRS